MFDRRNFIKASMAGVGSMAITPLMDFNLYPKEEKYSIFTNGELKDLKTIKSAYLETVKDKSKRKLSEKIIEKTNCKWSSGFAYNMAFRCGSDRIWAEKIIEKNRDGWSAFLMFKHCGSDPEWAKKILKKSEEKYIPSMKKRMTEELYV